MFGGAKHSFTQPATGTGFGFNNSSTVSPFGQPAFGKPTTAAFGQAPAFGTQQTTPSLFGAGTGQTNPTGLFGATNTSSAFGGTTTAQSTFGGFSQPQQNTSIFGAAAQSAANTSSLFGQPTTSAFGSAAKPSGFGFGSTPAQPTTSLFGQTATAPSNTGFGSFGQAATTQNNVFGSTGQTAFGQSAVAGTASGTAIAKYQATIGTDTLIKGGQQNNVNTKQHCITAMKEYEGKSLEELRMEDYLANRKGPQVGAAAGTGFFGNAQPTAATGGMFGTNTQQATGLFGAPAAGQPTENKSLFGQNTFGAQPTTAFGVAAQPQNSFLAKPFSTPATSTTGFAFGTNTADSSANPFGAKPAFGQTATPSLFGQPAASAAPAFGQNQTGFSSFGVPAQQTSVFGTTNTTDPNKPAFGLGGTSTASTGFGAFGTNANTSTASGGLFGPKPTTGFGANTFGTTSQANTGFSNFSLNTGGGLFNSSLQKPTTTGFGAFGTQTSAAPLNFNTGAPSLFGNTPAKPGGIFGNSLQTGTTGTGSLFGPGTGAFGTNTLGGSFGASSLGNTTYGTLGVSQQASIPIHQQILSKVTSPYGDNPIFKDLKLSRGDETDAVRATNPLAQKAFLDSTANQFKISTSIGMNSSIKVKPVGSAMTKKALFEGLEEFDSSVESFTLKPNAKRLIIKPKSSSNTVIGSTGANDSGTSVPSLGNTQNRQEQQQLGSRNNISNTDNDSFNGEIPIEKPSAVIVTDASRRESWLHPNNLEKVRQQNLYSSEPVMNNTLPELVSRKSTETLRTTTGKPSSPALNLENLNTSEDQSTALARRETVTDPIVESFNSQRSSFAESRSVEEDPQQDAEDPHPTGITLRRVGYYTIPSLDELKSYLAEDGSCVVPNFTIGREGYGNVYFNKEIDVAGLNLDEIVHFRNKEVIIYPNDDNKPPVGSGLNREAQITLDQVWPHDKTKHEPIKDPERLLEMDYESKLRRVCDKNDIRFIEYRPETGSWVFRVKHFSKYGLNDSDEEDDTPADAKKAKMNAPLPGAKDSTGNCIVINEKATTNNAKIVNENENRQLHNIKSSGGPLDYSMEEQSDFMLTDKNQFFQTNVTDYDHFDSSKRSGVVISPTAALAKCAGTDSHKLQLMKASFFMDDDIDGKSVLTESDHLQDLDENCDNRWGYYDIHSAGGLSRASSQSDFNGLRSPPQLSSSASGLSVIKEIQSERDASSPPPASEFSERMKCSLHTIKPKVAPIKVLAAQVPFSKSIAYMFRDKWLTDMAIYNSRRFKVGFGPKLNVIVPTTQDAVPEGIKNENLLNVSNKIFMGRSENDYSPIILQQVQISSTIHYENFKESVVNHLNLQLSNSHQVKFENTNCPMIKSEGGTELIVKHLDEAARQANFGKLEEYAVSVWSLCLALWGEHEELSGREPTSHFVIMSRRNLLSEWLETLLTDSDMLTKNVSKISYLDHVLNLLMCHKVIEACELAFMNDDANLSLLLAQLSSGPVVRQLIEDQLAAWHRDGADAFINVQRLKLFMLVAGVSLMESHHGPINIVEGFDWIKVLALQLWYMCSPVCSITDALLAYEKSFKASEFYSSPPTPSYAEQMRSQEKNSFHDLRYHILQLYSKRSHPLEGLLNPATHTPDPMDFRLSWFLLQTLEALGYRHCSELSETQLHVGFAAQLENYGMWEWSVFVLLHIKDRNQREISVQNMLYRYVTVTKDAALSEKEKFVITLLGVPEKWIDYAKAVKAGSLGYRHLQAKYLLKAKQWSLAHDIIFEHIAPDAVINDNLSYLHSLLSQFENPELHKNVKVPNWPNQGQILLDFIDISEKFKSLKTLHEGDIEARWENLKPQLSDLCSRINLFPCPTAKHRLCQCEIAQNLACLVRGVLLVCPVLNPCSLIKMALEKLPLPQEFANQELRVLLDTLVSDMCKNTK